MSETVEKVASSVVTSENLAEFNAKKLGLAVKQEPEPAPEQPETPAVDQSEPVAENEANQEEPQKKPNPKLERRFSDLTKQRELARQEAAEERRKREELEARLRELEQPKKVEADPDREPRPEDFSDAFEYARELAKHSAKKALAERDRLEAEKKAQEKQAQLINTWQKKLASAKAEMPDFDDMIASSDVRLKDNLSTALIESDVGPQLLYYFAENPEVAEKLNGLSDASALRELGKLEARLEKDKVEKVAPAARPRAAAPINPIRAVAAGVESGVDTDGEFRGSFQDYRAMRKAGKIR